MNKLTFNGNWNEIKGKMRQRYAMLTDQDLEFSKGDEEELFGRLESKLGKTKDQIRDIFGRL